jgi:uncharacterized iron-regulated membrane protein
MRFRQILFWFHLCAGVVAGIVVLIMSVTGAAIAFEKEIVAKAEQEVRRVPAPASGASRITLDALLDRVREKQPARPSAVTVFADPKAAVSISFGRTNALYANPYTGDVSQQGAPVIRSFMQVMTDWHRWLGREGDGRAVGKAITGACNVAFLFLAVSGICLWWPRNWSWTALKGIVLFNTTLRGKARDWNWHNVIGIWSAPVLVILTATAMIISYRWASDMVYKVTGTTPPAAGAGSGALSGAAVEMPQPAAGAKALGYEALVAAVQREIPQWEQISIRPGGPPQRSGVSPNADRPTGERGPAQPQSTPRPERNSESRNASQPVSVTVRELNGWPLFASIQLSVDPFTGSILKRESFPDYNTGRKVRTWMRFLHTGEALGFIGKLVAALASLGGAVLVWTGLTLAGRRFIAWRRKPAVGIPIVETNQGVPVP